MQDAQIYTFIRPLNIDFDIWDILAKIWSQPYSVQDHDPMLTS